jgi:hypothetical protein
MIDAIAFVLFFDLVHPAFSIGISLSKAFSVPFNAVTFLALEDLNECSPLVVSWTIVQQY